MESTKSFEPQVKVEREEEDLGTEISPILKNWVGDNCSNVKKNEVRPVKELLAKVVEVKSLEKSKDGRDYVWTNYKTDDQGDWASLRSTYNQNESPFR